MSVDTTGIDCFQDRNTSKRSTIIHTDSLVKATLFYRPIYRLLVGICLPANHFHTAVKTTNSDRV